MGIDYDGLRIYTIGHSNVAADRIVELLNQYQVEALVDVRSAPYSQYAPQFNRETFARTLADAGIAYTFAGEYLGGRPKDPTCYREGELPEGKANYLKRVDYEEVARRDWYQKGIARLVEIAGEHRTVIMCSEEDPDHCHRHHLIAQTLLQKGVAVWHIRSGGQVEAARPRTEAGLPKQLPLL